MFTEIGRRIRIKRENTGMTMKQVAEIIGVTEATFSRYESGHIGNVPLSRIEAIAKVFNCTPAHLMGWDEKQNERIEDFKTIKLMKEVSDYLQDTSIRSLSSKLHDNELPNEAIKELDNFIDYLKSKYRNK